jgi:Pro-kumamolisin, activation domain/Bacterial Ig-like domain (group 1)/Fibronectin type III domain
VAIAVALVLFTVIGASAANSADSAATSTVPLPGHVLPALARATPVARAKTMLEAETQAVPLALTVVLRRSDPQGFQAYLVDVYNPASANFHKFLSPTQIAGRFGPTAEDVSAVRSYFEQQGLAVSETPANRMTLVVTGSKAAVAGALAIRFNDYQIDDKTFSANDRDPSLPPDLAQRVEAISGLNTLAVPRRETQWFWDNVGCPIQAWIQANLINDQSDAKRKSDYEAALKKCRAAHGPATAANAQTAKDPPPPAWQGADGTGQTVGLVEFDTFQTSDVSDYIALLGLPAAAINNVSSVHVNGGAPAGANQSEVLLDIDDVLDVAPGARIVVFDAPFSGAGSFQAVFNAMINSGVTVISNSWAYCEDQTTLADVQSIETILQSAAASGISVLTGAGDHGSTCLDGSPNTAHVPATSPHITAVGGTSLTVGPGFTYVSETWWDGSADSPPGGQGGFGVSQFFARPAYQSGLTNSLSRSVPDVAVNADPREGVVICQASAGGCPSGLLYGGTSSATPIWAAFVALLNQAQGSNLGFLNPQIYPFAATDAFHGPASMGTDFAHVGLGSPDLARLHQRLTTQTPGAVSTTVSQVLAFTGGNFSVPASIGVPLPIPADGSSIAYVIVWLADANGNVLSGKTVTLSPSGSSAVITPSNGVSSANNGAVIFAVTDLNAETVTFTATDTTDGVVLSQTAKIGFGVPPAASGGINATPASVPPDQVSATTVTITLEDALNRPAPGKLIVLSQGSGHSVVAGPNPPVTDANGQIQFTATDGVSETVVYTALDSTDGDVPVPGSATVNFSGTATSCVGAAPIAAPGFTITPFATGFFAQNFFFGNVNWGGCPGASNPTFDPSGAVYAANFRTGDLFLLGLGGGAVSSSNTLSNLGLTLGQPTLGKDGRLYATHGATTGNFFTGNIVEIDRTTGAQLRVVAANLTCPNGLSVDPLSGDLFFDDQCFGAGSDNPSIWRIHDPGNTAVLSVYATLPKTPNGALSFSPDGTLYVVTGYNDPQPEIMAIAGTNSSSPPSMNVVPNIWSSYWVTLGQAQNNGAAKSLIVLDSAGLELVDLTTNPYTRTVLLTTGTLGSGVIGPDGCVYTEGSDTIYKIASANGTCGFAPTNPSPTLVLTPAAISPNPAQGGSQTFTATFQNLVVPVGTPVYFDVIGANTQSKFATTNASGVATATYLGLNVGVDKVMATGIVGNAVMVSNSARFTWGAGTHAVFIDLSTSPSSGPSGQAVVLSASLSDGTLNPITPIAGATIQLSLGAQSCIGVTNASGVATCSVSPTTPGQLDLVANYTGSALYTPASVTQTFNVVAAGGGTAPGTPSIVQAVAGDGLAVITFTPPLSDGGSPITSYLASCTPTAGGMSVTATSSNSPVTVSGLTNGVTYACTVNATNAIGPGANSSPSNPVTPAAEAASVAQNIPTLDPVHQLMLANLLALLALGALWRRRARR